MMMRPAVLLLLMSQLLLPIATQASSSYLDDYFSTAKYALNKLQQSLTTPDSGISSSSSNNFNNLQAAADKSSEATTTPATTTTTPQFTPDVVAAATQATQTTSSATQTSEPDKSEFVRVDTSSFKSDQDEATTTTTASSAAATAAAEDSTQKAEESTVVVVSAAASDTDETVTSSARPAPEDGPSLVVVAGDNRIVSGEQDTPVIGKAPSEDSIKEIEMNAVAAVDMSIGFGNDLNNMFNGDKEPCYDEYGNPRFCEPEFENVAFERQVEVSSECGQPASRFCTTSPSSSAESQIRNCHICDSQQPKKRHPPSYLTDLNNANNPTCWVSAPIQATSSLMSATNMTNTDQQQQQQQQQQLIKGDNVTLQVNLDKRYEILYVSMQFCSLKPDSLSIHKSNDFGQSWQAYQFYSSHCARLYNRQPSSSSAATASAGGKSIQSTTAAAAAAAAATAEPSCSNISSSGSSATRVAFSTLDGARVGLSLDKSPALQDWISATNIRITLDRHQAAWVQSTLLAPHSRHSSTAAAAAAAAEQQQQQQKSSVATNVSAAGGEAISATAAATASSSMDSSLTNPSSDTFNYAISDLTIGGRCKCNGHASRCIHGKDGRLQCDCRHNTAGRDCEKCAPLHADRPWARATPTEANICQACNCNGHSRKCRFDAELYRLSGRRSGGVCLQCKDNTDGRYCHYCKEGFTRDHSKPMSDKEACKACDCHPIGSLGRVCNQTTGQCPCKEGVTGPLCNRCAPGYQQSSSQSEPCIRIPPPEATGSSNEINNELSATDATIGAEEQPMVDPSATMAPESDSPTIVQEEAQLPNQLQQQQHQPQLPIMTSHRAPPGGADLRWQDQNQDQDQYSSWPLANNNNQDGNLDDGDEGARYIRPGSNQYQWPVQPTGVMTMAGRKRPLSSGQYYGASRYHVSSQRRPQFELTNDNGNYEEDLMEAPLNRVSAAPDRMYGVESDSYPRHQRPRYRQQHYQQQQQQHYRPIVPPVANLNPSDDEEEQYSGTIYSDESNQISAHRRLQQQQQQQQQPQHHQQPMYTKHMPAAAAGGGGGQSTRRPSTSGGNSLQSNVHPNNNVNNILSQQCGECQSSAPRRLKGAKFCELEFAIRCSILNKFVAEDWTRLEIEIQDIFKSPMGVVGSQPLSDLSSSSGKQMAAADMSNGMQQDAPVAETATNSSSKIATADNEIVPQHHRLKVGTMQTIWVPTEDLACKCLRLKRGSTYLLMGTIDAKENSVNSLQLDRHGVALVWSSSVQSRILKLQRKYARGSLCV